MHENMIEIPWQNLPEATLQRLLAEIVTRDGTDYGDRERSEHSRVEEAQCNLREGRAVLVWNSETESASLVDRRSISG